MGVDRSRKVRRIKVLYVEDDAALRSLVAQQLIADERLELVCMASDSHTSLEFSKTHTFDVGLLDLALGRGSISGIELAIALRRQNSNCGLVIFSQHSSEHLITRLPLEQRYSFSVLEKRAPIDFELLISTLVHTAGGLSSIDSSLKQSPGIESLLEPLSDRDHEIMRLLIDGKSTNHISTLLSLAPVTVRQEISRIYGTLVPDKTEDTNLRTKAIMRYLEEVRSF
jgi:DNA-binding NarL/FixJ family response regulator